MNEKRKKIKVGKLYAFDKESYKQWYLKNPSAVWLIEDATHVRVKDEMTYNSESDEVGVHVHFCNHTGYMFIGVGCFPIRFIQEEI